MQRENASGSAEIHDTLVFVINKCLRVELALMTELLNVFYVFITCLGRFDVEFVHAEVRNIAT